MTDYFVQTCISNVLLALLLAIVAVIVSRKSNWTGLAYLLWMLVLLKLVTPPLLSIPIPNMLAVETTPAAIVDAPASTGLAVASGLEKVGDDSASVAVVNSPAINWNLVKSFLVALWLAGTVVSIVISLCRVTKFNRLLRSSSKPTAESVAREAAALAVDLQLARHPQLRTTSANVSPMVWWCGGQVQVVLPDALLEEIEPDQWRWALAHELAHVQRRDYLVRWLEWLACSVFWWNPLAWYARKNLRAAEEICCDAMVLSRLKPEPLVYANSILNVVESLVRPAIRPPAMASEINSDGFLERRFEMILSQNSNSAISRWSRVVAFGLLFVMPLGLAQAQDFEKVEKRLAKMVKNGEINGDQSDAMMIALKKAAEKTQNKGEEKAIGEEDVEKMAGEIEAAVASGEITREQAREKHEYVRGVFAKSQGRESGEQGDEKMMQRKKRYAAGAKKIKAAVDAGKVSEEDAEKRLVEMREKMFGDGDAKNDPMGGMMRRLKMAVESGRITQEQANERASAYKMELKKKRYQQGEGAIKKAVEAGKLSEEDAEKRLIEMREKMFGGQNEKESGKNGPSAGEHSQIKRRIRMAVENGDLTREQAEKKIAEIDNQNMLNVLGTRLREAVASGDLNKEEAKEMFDAVKAHQADREHMHDHDGDGPHDRDR